MFYVDGVAFLLATPLKYVTKRVEWGSHLFCRDLLGRVLVLHKFAAEDIVWLYPALMMTSICPNDDQYQCNAIISQCQPLPSLFAPLQIVLTSRHLKFETPLVL